MMDRMKERIKNAKFIVMENVGHLPHEEAYNEFNQYALQFLTAKEPVMN